MRRWWGIGMVGLLALLLGWLVWAPEASQAPAPGAASRPVELPDGVFVGPLSRSTPPVPPEVRGSLSIQGRVVGPEGPVPGALVVALASAPPEWLARLPSQEDVSRWNVRCDPSEAMRTLLELAAERRGREAAPAHATTDAHGSFRIGGLEAGTFTLWAERGNDVGLQWEVAAGSEDVEVRLGAGRALSGEVRDEQGGAVAGVLVTTLPRDLGRFVETTTDAEGQFLLGPLPWEGYTLLLSKEGFLPARLQARDNQTDGYPVTLLAPRRIAGRVLDERGPARGVAVQAEDDVRVPPATTDGRGAFVLEGLCPGPHVVTASREGLHARQQVEGDAVELVLGASLRLSGRVTSTSGRPIDGAEVSISSEPPSRSRTVRTDSRGGFLIEPLAPGTYGMSVQAMRYVRREIPARLIEASEELQVSLKEAWLVEGRTVDAGGAPVEGVSLRLSSAADASGPFVASARSGADGAFTLEAPEPGPWRVLASHPDFLSGDFPLSAPSRDARLEMRSGASLEVELVDAAGRPVSHTNIVAWRRGGFVRTLRTDAEGRAVFRGLSPGRYTLRTMFPAGTSGFAQLEDVEVRGVEARTVRFQLEEGGSPSGQVVDRGGHRNEGASVSGVRGRMVREDGRTVRGRVIAAGTPAPVVGAQVELSGSTQVLRVTTLSDGSFTGEGWVGKARVSVNHPDYLPGRTVLEEGQREVSVVLDPGARLRGRIESAGVPVRSGTVQLRSEQGVVVTTTGFWEGRYSLRAIPAGRYLVQVVAQPDEGPAPMFPLQPVELSSGGAVTLDFTEQVAGAAVEVFVPERNIEVHLLPGNLPLMGPKQGLYSKLGSGLMGKPVREGARLFSRVPAGRYTLFAMRRDEDVTSVHREELEVPAGGQVSFSLLPQWSLYDD